MGSPDADLPPQSLSKQIDFILEIDRLKSVLRRTSLLDRSRRENTAEHSWQIALMAVLLAEHADPPVDINHVVVMLLVHDLVEIDAGDTFIYDEQALATKTARELGAAEQIAATAEQLLHRRRDLEGARHNRGSSDRPQRADRRGGTAALGVRARADQRRRTPGFPTSSGRRSTRVGERCQSTRGAVAARWCAAQFARKIRPVMRARAIDPFRELQRSTR